MNIALYPIHLKRQEWYDAEEYTLYFPKDNIIIQKIRDENDVIYRFYDVYHVPEFKMVLFLSGYAITWMERMDTGERIISSLDKNIESRIRDIMELPQDYIVTDSRDLFKQKRSEFIAQYKMQNSNVTNIISEYLNNDIAQKIMDDHILEDKHWFAYDVDSVEPLNGKYFVDDYPEDDDVDRQSKIKNIWWNEVSWYVDCLMSYFEYVDRPEGTSWNECKICRSTAVVLWIDEEIL